MVKTYTLQNLGCPNCATKMERAIGGLSGVKEASVSYQNKLLRLDAEDVDALLPQMQSIVQGIESDVRIVPRRRVQAQQQESCACGHDHGEHDHEHGDVHDHSHGHDHQPKKNEKRTLIAGGILFALAMAAHLLWEEALPVAAWVAIFAVPYLILAADIFKEAWSNIRRGDVFDENFLMLVASIGAFAILEYPEAVAVMLFYRVGEYFEHLAVERSRAAIMETVDMRPEAVTRLRAGAEERIPAEEAQIGDVLILRPGDRVPLDGTVLTGESRLDTSAITGEPVPVSVGPGSEIMSGSINQSGALSFQVSKRLEDSLVSRILDAVENASANKPQIERFISRFARIYTPVVVFMALALAVLPPLIGGGAWSEWVYRALNFLVVSCPCALVLSVPLAYFAGIGRASRQGILFKGGASLEALYEAKVVIFDKTGTLTQGSFKVRELRTAGGRSEDELLALAASAEFRSTHPIGESIRAAAQERGLTVAEPTALEEIAGHGLKAQIDGQSVLAGNAALMAREGVALPAAEEDGTLVYLAVDGVYAGALRVADQVKPDARQAVAALKARGLHTVMLTGDNQATAARIAAELDLDGYQAGLLPDEKLDAMRVLREQYGRVLFVGDGINDAPVLAGADVGAAMGSGADAAIEAADFVVMNMRVQSVADALDVAGRTRRIAIQNIVFALGFKILVLVLSVLGLTGLWMAVFADVGVALLCVLNSLRLSWAGRGAPKQVPARA